MRLLWISLVAVLSACHSVGHNTQSPRIPSVLDNPVEFVGSRGATFDPELLGEIRLGMFAPNPAEGNVGREMFEGAELAIERINSSGGVNGAPIRLLRRWDADPWRGGSKEVIKLVYEDSVWAVIGSVSGEATHVAEQVVTKAWVPLLSPVSADPTLTYIRIPWMFRLPPDDEKQADVLVHDGIEAHSLSSVGLITSTDHDGRIFAEAMLEQMAARQQSPAFHLQVAASDTDISETNGRASSFRPDGVVLRLPRDGILALLDSFEAAGLRVPVLIPWIPGLSPADLRGRYAGQIWYVRPFSEIDNRHFAVFASDYRKRYGAEPTPSAAYTFDAVNIVVQAVREVGLNRAELRDAIAGVSGYIGVTGSVTWDNAGGNQAKPTLVTIHP